MLASIVHEVYIDPEWVAAEYLRRCEGCVWDNKSTTEALKSWNLKRVIHADLRQIDSPEKITMDEFVAETERPKDNTDGKVQVVQD